MATTIMEAALTHVVPEQVVREINDEHRAAALALRAGLEHARRAGELLMAAKDALPHGAFMAWVERHCEFAHRTATLYMRIAAEWERIDSNWQSVADLGLAALDRWLTHGSLDPPAPVVPDVEADPVDERRLARWAAEDAEWEAELERMRSDPDAHLTKDLWRQVGESLGAAHDALTRLQDHVGEGNPIVEQMLAVVERLDEERFKQESALDEIADAEVAAGMEADKAKMLAAPAQM